MRRKGQGSLEGIVRVLGTRTVYRGRVCTLIRERIQIRDRVMVRDTIEHPGAVVIVPVVDRASLVFVRQYRRAVRQVLLELPAGTLSKGERRLACARRELEEETGWRARRWRQIGQFYAAPGLLSEQMTVFLAQDLRYVGAHPEPDEVLVPVVLSVRQALQAVRSGAICDAKTIIGVLLAAQQLGVASR